MVFAFVAHLLFPWTELLKPRLQSAPGPLCEEPQTVWGLRNSRAFFQKTQVCDTAQWSSEWKAPLSAKPLILSSVHTPEHHHSPALSPFFCEHIRVDPNLSSSPITVSVNNSCRHCVLCELPQKVFHLQPSHLILLHCCSVQTHTSPTPHLWQSKGANGCCPGPSCWWRAFSWPRGLGQWSKCWRCGVTLGTNLCLSEYSWSINLDQNLFSAVEVDSTMLPCQMVGTNQSP